MTLVDIKSIIPGLEIDLKYATKDNFTGQVVYQFQTCLLIEKTAKHLLDVYNECRSFGLGLKVWDGYRPMEAQEKFWEILPDERYISNPKEGGRHTRGTAVDLTLTLNGKELEMPSAFDEFNEKAHVDYLGATSEAQKNRDLLIALMKKHNFIPYPTEWWHFDMVGWENYPPISQGNYLSIR